MRRARKKTLFMGFLLLVLTLGLGYALITTTLNIEGTTDIDSNTWNVYWNNLQFYGNEEIVIQEPTINPSKPSQITYQITLNEPGDRFWFKVDAVNDGSIDAMISSITQTINGLDISNLPVYLKYTIKYMNGLPVHENQLLRSNERITYMVEIKYRNDIDPSYLPSSPTPLSLSMDIPYEQADGTGEEINGYEFLYNVLPFKVGDSLPDYDIEGHLTYQEVMVKSKRPFFIRTFINDNKFEEAKLGFVYQNNLYYLTPMGATYNESYNGYNYDSIYYEPNKELLLSIFGAENCNEDGYDNFKTFICGKDNLTVDITNLGMVGAVGYGDTVGGCSIATDGEFNCYFDF